MAFSFRRLSKSVLITANVVVVVSYLLACVQPWLNPENFWIIGFLSLAMPYLLCAVVGFALFWLLAKPQMVFISLLTLVISYKQIGVLFNLYKPDFIYAPAQQQLRVLSWNVKSFQGLGASKAEKQQNADRLFALVEKLQPDVVCFQEFGEFEKPGLGQDYTGRMHRLGYSYQVQSKDYSRTKYYYTSGLAIFSRFPIVAKKRIPFSSSPESLLYADVVASEKDTIRIFTTHLQSFRFSEHEIETLENREEEKEKEVMRTSLNIIAKMKRAFRNRGAQADQIAPYLDSCQYPMVVTGDFNDVPNSYAYWKIRGEMNDAFLEKGFGLGRTFITLAPTLRIDYIFAPAQLPVSQFATLTNRYSDHLPVVADLWLPSAIKGSVEKPLGKSRKSLHP